MADEKPPPLEDEDAFYRRVSRRLEADTDGPTPSQAANRRAVLNTMGASKVSEDGEIEGLDSMTEDYYGDPDLDRRVEEHSEKKRTRPSTEIRPLKFTDDPAMYLRGKVNRVLDKGPGGEEGGALPVSAGPIPGIIPWFINLARTDPKDAAKLFAEVTGSVLNPAVDAAISARDLAHAVDTGNVPLGVLAGAGLIVPGYSGAKAVGKKVAGQLAEKGAKEGAEKVAKEGAEKTARTLSPGKQQEELRGMIERDVGQTTGAEPEVGELEDFIRRHQNEAKVRQLNLTPQDYDDLAATIKANGGATFDLGSKTHAGSGYSIAPFKATEFSVAPENFNAETIETYIRTNSDLIEVDGMHFGAWFNDDTGEYVYDVSMVAPNTPAGRLLSARLAKQGKQDAVWHLDIGKEIKTLDLEAEYGGEILKGATTPEYESLSQVLGRITRPVHSEGTEGLARKFGISEEEVGGLAEKRMQAVRKALAGQK